MQRVDKDLEKFKEVASSRNASEQHLREFMQAYQEEFNEELTPSEASVMLTQLVQLYLHISRPLPPNPVQMNEGGTL